MKKIEKKFSQKLQNPSNGQKTVIELKNHKKFD